MANPSAHPFPAESFTEFLSKYIFSRKGEEGLLALADRVREHWNDLETAWRERETLGGPRTLGMRLLNAAISCDRSDILARDIPLRSGRFYNLQGLLDSRIDTDINVCSKLVHAFIEILAYGKSREIFTAFSMIASSNATPAKGDYAFVANVVLIGLHLEKGEYDLAIAAAKKNLSIGVCPTSQFMLYKSLSAKKKSGAPVPATEMCLDDLSDRFCSEPFDTLATGSAGRKSGSTPFFACQCPGTLPYPVSNYEEGLSLASLWNGPEIREIRRSILDGDFTYCSRTCPKLMEKSLPKRSEITDPRLRDIIDNRRTELATRPIKLTLGHDPSCNIVCPSCRNELIFIKDEARKGLDQLSKDILLPLMEDTPLSLIISTDGDPIGSRHYRKIIHSLDQKRHAQIRLMLITNGLLFTAREWDALKHVQPMVAFVGVSIDAAHAETYEDLRRPGKWATITANMDFLGQLRHDGQLPHLGMQFVVQQKNFDQMAEFVELGRKWNADTIRFIRLRNIGSYTSAVFEENDVSNPRHPLHPCLLKILRDPIFRDPRVSMFTLSPLWENANAPSASLVNSSISAMKSLVRKARRNKWLGRLRAT